MKTLISCWSPMRIALLLDLQPQRFVFLLTLLPNIHELTAPTWWNNFPGRIHDRWRTNDIDEFPSLLFYHTLEQLRVYANQGRDNSLSPLEKLNTSFGSNKDIEGSLDVLVPLLAINSLKTFAACNFITKIDDGASLIRRLCKQAGGEPHAHRAGGR